MKPFNSESHYLIQIPTIPDERGKLSVVEPHKFLPFNIQRAYYLFDIPAGAERGGHAHKDLDQLLFALSGSFSVEIEDENGRMTYTLNRPNEALYIGSMVWREMKNFSSNAVCFVLASKPYDESDYIRSHAEFRNLLNKR